MTLQEHIRNEVARNLKKYDGLYPFVLHDRLGWFPKKTIDEMRKLIGLSPVAQAATRQEEG